MGFLQAYPERCASLSHRAVLRMTNGAATPARNFLVLFLSQGVGKFAGLIFGFVAARWLGSAGFGNYAVVSAFLSYFMVLTDFGLSPLLVREMSQKHFKSETRSIF